MFPPPRLVKRRRNTFWWITLLMATLAGTAAGRCFRQKPGPGVDSAGNAQCRQGQPGVPGAFNRYGSEGPKHSATHPRIHHNPDATRGRQRHGVLNAAATKE